MVDKAQLYRYKGNRCSVCGLSAPEMIDRFGTFHRMFEFHHINPESKNPNYNNIIKRKISTLQLDEIDKCILLCRVCHGLVHAQNIKAKLNLSLKYEGRDVSQEFNGWLVYDFKENAMRFLSEEKTLIHPYLSKFNDEVEELIFGKDLNTGAYFKSALSKLNIGDVFTIFNACNHKCMLQATHLGEKIKVDHNVSFGFLEIEAKSNTHGGGMWCRNGLILMENGEVLEGGFISYLLDSSELR